MFRRRRRASRVTVLVGMVAALAVGWLLAASTASSRTPAHAVELLPASSASAAPVTGAVDVTGAPIGGAHGWSATRVQPGRYQLTFAADLALDVLSWDVPAAMTVKPIEAGSWLVDFIEAGTPIDTAFSFTASLPSE